MTLVSDWDLWKKKFQVVVKNHTCSQNVFCKEENVADLLMYYKVKIRQKINNYNIRFSLVDGLHIAASYLEKCWVEHHYCSNQVLVLGYSNGICHCLQVRVGNKDKTIIRITVSNHMEQLDTETSVKLFVFYMLILRDSKLFLSHPST